MLQADLKSRSNDYAEVGQRGVSVGEVEVVVRQLSLPVEDEVAKFSTTRTTVASTLRTTCPETLLTDWKQKPV